MLNAIRTLRAEIARAASFRVTFALMPFRGSDREVGWSSLEIDRARNRSVTYITAPVDYQAILGHFPESQQAGKNEFLELGTVRVVAWPFDLPPRIFRIGYLRYIIWIVALQFFFLLYAKRENATKIHFLTYTQLATPILLSRRFEVYHGPAGVIPKLPPDSPVSKTLKLKSKLMWKLIMPMINRLKRNKPVRTSVVHENLLTKDLEDDREIVLSALNIDYLEERSVTDDHEFPRYDVVVVARDVAFKNLDIVRSALANAGARHGVTSVIINGSLPAAFSKTESGVTELGRQDRNTVFEYLKGARLHLMLSVELGGYINLEAASCGLPTLCLDGFGASAMLRPGPQFLFEIGALNATKVADRVSTILADEPGRQQEALQQSENAKEFIAVNRSKFENWLEEAS